MFWDRFSHWIWNLLFQLYLSVSKPWEPLVSVHLCLDYRCSITLGLFVLCFYVGAEIQARVVIFAQQAFAPGVISQPLNTFLISPCSLPLSPTPICCCAYNVNYDYSCPFLLLVLLFPQHWVYQTLPIVCCIHFSVWSASETDLICPGMAMKIQKEPKMNVQKAAGRDFQKYLESYVLWAMAGIHPGHSKTRGTTRGTEHHEANPLNGKGSNGESSWTGMLWC